jgi:hypothetical protein
VQRVGYIWGQHRIYQANQVIHIKVAVSETALNAVVIRDFVILTCDTNDRC